MIKIDKLTKRYGKKIVLNNINFELPDSGIIGLIGKNGSGKTTLLRILAGLRKKSSGKMIIKGEIHHINQLFSITPDANDIYDYTLYELGKLFADFYNDFNEHQYQKLVINGNLILDGRFQSLSKGQKMFVLISLTISRDVPIYLLDEPFSGLDILVRKEIIDKIIKILDFDKKLMIISSHDMEHLERLNDDIIVLKEGKLHYYKNEEIVKYESLTDFYKAVI